MGLTKDFLDRDKLFSIHPNRIGTPVFEIVDKLHRYPGPLQIMATAAAFVMLCERYNLHPGTVAQAAANMLKQASKYSAALRAAEMSINLETDPE